MRARYSKTYRQTWPPASAVARFSSLGYRLWARLVRNGAMLSISLFHRLRKMTEPLCVQSPTLSPSLLSTLARTNTFLKKVVCVCWQGGINSSSSGRVLIVQQGAFVCPLCCTAVSLFCVCLLCRFGWRVDALHSGLAGVVTGRERCTISHSPRVCDGT